MAALKEYAATIAIITNRRKGRRLMSPVADSAYSPAITNAKAITMVTAYRSHVCPKQSCVILSRMLYALNASLRKKRLAK